MSEGADSSKFENNNKMLRKHFLYFGFEDGIFQIKFYGNV